MASDRLMHGLVAGVLLLGLCAYSFIHPNTQLVVIDMKRAIEQPALLLTHSKLSEAEQSALMQRYSRLLPKVIQSYGQSQHVLVLSSPVIVSQKNLDITDRMIEATLSRLKQQGRDDHE